MSARQRGVNLLVVAAAATCTIAALEAGARLVTPPAVPRVAMYRPAGDVGYELAPGYRGTGVCNEPVRINAHGMRGGEIGPKPPGVKRVLVLGDSFVFGVGLTEEESFPSALARALRGATDADIEVLNAGVPGYNLFQEVRVLERRAAAFAPDAIVLGFVENDLYNVDDSDLVAAPDGTLAQRPGSFQPSAVVNPFAALAGPWAWLQLHSAAFRTASTVAVRRRLALHGDEELVALAARLARGSDLPARLLRGDDDPETIPRWNAVRHELEAASAAARALGAPLVVVLLPRPQQLYTPVLCGGFARIAAAAAAAGLSVVDPTPALAAVPNRVGLYLFPVDHHMNARGYELVAAATAQALNR
jgi:lysophospholipase L1-like esterase